MTDLDFVFLRAFTVTVDGHPLTAFASDKVRALLAYLILEPAQAHSRPALAALFWPDIGNQYALQNLRSTLWRLRQTLDQACPDLSSHLLSITRQTVWFNPAPHPAPELTVTVDVTTFQTWLAASQAHPHDRLTDCSICLAYLTQAADLLPPVTPVGKSASGLPLSRIGARYSGPFRPTTPPSPGWPLARRATL